MLTTTLVLIINQKAHELQVYFKAKSILFAFNRTCFSCFSNHIFPVCHYSRSIYYPTEKAISGIVFDGGMNEPLIGANVVIKGTTNGTVTDLDGKFTLEANPNDILVISSIGFKTVEIKASEAAKGKITLTEDSQALDEVIVVGYGVQKKPT